MPKGGHKKAVKGVEVEEYFEMFRAKKIGLDFDDCQMLSSLFQYSSLCPRCYRPYAMYQLTVEEDKSSNGPHSNVAWH